MKVEDYVRTNNGNIGKIIDMRIEDDYLLRERYGDKIYLDHNRLVLEKEIIKSSPNIIDLIEIGDYVNGCYVTNRQASHNEGIAIIPKRIGIIKCNAYFNQGNYNDCDFKWIEEKDIKSIVTKEQFESMEYEVGDE